MGSATQSRPLQSAEPLPGFKLWRKDYVSVVEATVQRSTQKLSAGVNDSADYRGGGNDTGRDGTYRSKTWQTRDVCQLYGFPHVCPQARFSRMELQLVSDAKEIVVAVRRRVLHIQFARNVQFRINGVTVAKSAKHVTERLVDTT